MLKAAAALLLIAPFLTANTSEQRRLPEGFKWGRCLLEVDSKTYISGRCSYHLSMNGDFEIHGPKQVWGGIDYPKTQAFSGERSEDYFAQVNMNDDGTAEGAWNWDKRATHAHTHLGTLERKGACWVNRKARACVWK